MLLLYTGVRVGEALWLESRQLDLQRNHVSFPMTRNGDARGMPQHPRVVARLANLPHREGELFRRPDRLPYERSDDEDGEHVSAGSCISTAFAGVCRRANVTDFHPHNCRHTWATWHHAANRDLGAPRQLAG